MPSLKLSLNGLQIVKQARQEKAWTIDNPRWLEEASQIIEPGRDWENAEVFAAGVSLSTWKRFLKGDAIDASVLKAFCQVLGLNWQDLLDRPVNSSASGTTQIPNIPLFFGRRYELARLTQAVEQGTRLIVITGMGGIGKTALAAKLAEASKYSFQQTLWFDFHVTPPTIDLLPLLLPKTLLVFDGWDRILGGDANGGLRQRAGQYRLEYESYAGFLRSVVQTNHSSCVILTSREQPEELNTLSGNGAVIFPLGGLMEGAIELLQHHRLIFDAQQWITLVNQYGGNPLFLNMAANFIQELFAGDVGEFLASGTLVAGEFEPLVAQWLREISMLEQTLIKCLATQPQGLTREEILLHFENHPSNGDILAGLLSLKRRALVETTKDDNKQRFFLQPVILKCVQRLFKSQE
ncbi:ATP-binding protein [Desmonostoc muscorum CCALA 125]|nr:ATP-binding protein [Desmonostoc muscorum CCALA 125]